MSNEIDQRIIDMKKEFFHLVESPIFKIIDITKNSKSHSFAGVYLIKRHDTKEPIYIGRTITGTIAGRMRDHLSVNRPRDLNVMIKKYPNLPQDKISYLVQYIIVEDLRKRFLLENFFVSIVNPFLNGDKR